MSWSEEETVKEITQDNYREYPAINYSLLSTVSRDPRGILDEKEETEAMSMGSALDCYLTDRDNFNDQFFVYKEDMPTATLLEIAELCHRDGVYEEADIEGIVNSKNGDKFIYWGSSTKKETRKNKWNNSQFWDYLDALKKVSEGKTMLSMEQYSKITKAADTLKNHEFTAKFFDESQENIDVYFQVPVTFELNGHRYKSLLDILIVDHNNETIHPIDLKSTQDYLSKFERKFYFYRYDIQASLYTKAAQAWREAEKLHNYKIKVFKFVVISFMELNRPMIFETTPEILKFGMNGGTLSNGTMLKGFKQLTEDYFWHESNDKYDYQREIYESNGVVQLKLI